MKISLLVYANGPVAAKVSVSSNGRVIIVSIDVLTSRCHRKEFQRVLLLCGQDQFGQQRAPHPPRLTVLIQGTEFR